MIQKLIAIGHLGQDPDVRYLPSGQAVANFSVAVTEKWKKDGQQQERTEWLNCAAFGKLGEIAGQYLHKGSKVYIEGKLQTDQFEKDGQKHYRTKINVRELQFLDSRGEQSQAQGHSGSHGQAAGPEPQGGDFDSDIPFMRIDGRLY
jgi:single-strand DNA-binding protein